MHAVVKQASSTTKLRVVYDASAKSSSGISLNDVLEVGPTLNPTLQDVLLRFRTYKVAVTADISKMYREILLHLGDRQLHRFLWRPKQEGPVEAYCMNRVTFGVTSSPYLAIRTLHQVVADFGSSTPLASRHVKTSMYVDDLLAGGDTVEEALELFAEIRSLLKKGSFNIVKWRSSSPGVISEIPGELCEKVTMQDLVDRQEVSHPKALGLCWDSGKDVMATQVDLPSSYGSTKRGIVSDVSRVFDVLGWLAPAILPMKALFQSLWELGIGWDDPVPAPYRTKHERWREELRLLSKVTLQRCYFAPEPTVTITLHGFCDASKVAYAAVVYLRATYQTRAPTCCLVVAKTKVAPLKLLTIPRLELCGAALLARLLESTRQALGLPVECVSAWCDSTIVLAWLDGSPSPRRYRTYVGNRLASIHALVPAHCWKHVPTGDNPADCASRGVSPGELVECSLWWSGPQWLLKEPVEVPPQPGKSDLGEVASLEERGQVVNVVAAPPALWLEDRYSSYHKLIRVTAWIHRFFNYFKSKLHTHTTTHNSNLHQSTKELDLAEVFLLKSSQQRAFYVEVQSFKHSPPTELSRRSNLLPLNPFLGEDGLLHVGGRLANSSGSFIQKHPIILFSHDTLVKLIFICEHLRLAHCGPTMLLSTVGQKFHIVGARRASRSTCSSCTVCRKASATGSQQLMGQLPSARVTAGHPFSTTGVDYAGPFQIKLGRVRRPVMVKAYLAIFVCLATKAAHIEVVSDATTEAFLAALRRFIARRGLPSHLHSDHGSNHGS